jgi:hypothetical protein
MKYWFEPQHHELAAFAAILAGDPDLVEQAFNPGGNPTTSKSASGLRGSRRTATNSAMVHSFRPQRMLAQLLPKIIFDSRLFCEIDGDEVVTGWLRRRMAWQSCLSWSLQDQLDPAQADSAMILGFLQDVGMRMMLTIKPNRYRVYLTRWQRGREASLWRCERVLFGYTHADLTARILDHWRFPPELVNLLQDHHRKDRLDRNANGTLRRLLRVIRLAETIADLDSEVTDLRLADFEARRQELLLSSDQITGGIFTRAVEQLRGMEERTGFDFGQPASLKQRLGRA